MISAVDREVRLGLWKIHILHHAATRPVWGMWLLEELAEHGYKLSPGTLYPALTQMERNGWLRRTSDASHARARQALRITPQGRRLLQALRREVTELYEEVVLGREPEHPEETLKHPKPKRTLARAQTTRGKQTTRRRP